MDQICRRSSMQASVLGGLNFKELMERVWGEAWEDRCLGRSAELAFYLMMALFPLLIFLLSLLSFIPGASDIILAYLGEVMPRQAMDVVEVWVDSVFSSGSGSLLSFSILFSVWAASTGMAALMDVLNTAYEIKEGRPFWKARLVAIGLTITLCLLVVGGAALVTFGDQIVGRLISALSIGDSFAIVWQIINYVIGVVMLFIGIGVIYHSGPNVRQNWKQSIPGTIFAVASFLAVSYLFSLYLKFFPSYDATYGSLGAIIILMLWLYLMSLVIMVGGEINSEIDKVTGAPVLEKEKPEHERAA
jgi:membrane protein